MLPLTIIFGLHLDGQRAFSPVDRLGEIAVGPLGFLTILETQLGLLGMHASQAERIVQYCDCLAQADSPERFYHASFATDALGTAATLLGWRDLWHLYGWKGDLPANAGRRLTDIADVDALAHSTLAPSPGERLAQILAQLKIRRLAVSEVRLADQVATFPKRWQEVLALLPVANLEEVRVRGKGFLGSLQHKLERAVAGQKFDKSPWDDDGTVMVVQGETRALSGAWLADQIDEKLPTLIVSSMEGARLDDQLVVAGQARHGLREASAFRPALQVLPLALELLWDPLNFYGLLQFLTHPVCPVPGHARRRLAGKVADKPGIGGKAWEATLKDIDLHYGEQAAPAIRKKIQDWIEHPRFPQEDGAPIAMVLERVIRLAEFFQTRLGDEDAARRLAFNAGFAQCHACVESLSVLQSQGVLTIRPRQLQQLVGQATASGTDNPLLIAEVGAQMAVTHPGAAVEQTERVIWWQLAMPTLPTSYPWSAAEVLALAHAGVALPEGRERLAQAAREWLRPILAARTRLIVVLPPKGEEVHPIWQMIEAGIDSPRVQSLDSLLAKPTPGMQSVTHVPLPAAQRWWQLPQDVSISLRETESFSSLELLLFNPYHWLLKYPAKLRPSRIIDLGGNFRMLGNLAHELVERYYQRDDALSMAESQYSAWFDPAFDQLITEEGALLRMAGMGADLEGFRHRLRNSIRTLRQQVAYAGILKVDSEIQLSGHFAGGELSGYADLVMQKAGGAQAIIDMKWSGVKKFPSKLKENRHLQLAIYAELLRQKTGNWPAVAYYILDQARFFAPNDLVFADADVVPSADGENTAQLWQRFVETWKWRRSQIARGLIEVALEGVEETEQSSPPDTAMTMEYLNEGYNDYRALAGWEQ